MVGAAVYLYEILKPLDVHLQSAVDNSKMYPMINGSFPVLTNMTWDLNEFTTWPVHFDSVESAVSFRMMGGKFLFPFACLVLFLTYCVYLILLFMIHLEDSM